MRLEGHTDGCRKTRFRGPAWFLLALKAAAYIYGQWLRMAARYTLSLLSRQNCTCCSRLREAAYFLLGRLEQCPRFRRPPAAGRTLSGFRHRGPERWDGRAGRGRPERRLGAGIDEAKTAPVPDGLSAIRGAISRRSWCLIAWPRLCAQGNSGNRGESPGCIAG